MNPQPYEIYEARIRLGKADYPRPCLIMTVPIHGVVAAFPITSALDVTPNSPFHFFIRSDDPDFAKTGLTKDCCIVAERFVDVQICDLIRKRGQLEGNLLKRFLKWI